ncbi:MAG: aminomethyl-transferring glycine dehydrogenase subunit GcvPA [Spirochaetia bacterium]
MVPYIPRSNAETREMLDFLGLGSLEDLFEDLPQRLRLERGLELDDGKSELEVLREFERLSGRNAEEKISFLGSGRYDHWIPSVVDHVIGKSGFYTAYTPYQAEISQGLLKGIFEFQTVISELTGLDVANASLYDEATAAVEAVWLALNTVKESNRFLYSETVQPSTVEVLASAFSGGEVSLEMVKSENGTTSYEDLTTKLGPGAAGVLVQSPNRYGYIEDYTGFAEAVKEAGALFVVSANPLSLGVCAPPGEWGADVALGGTQPLGIPVYAGGPAAGYMAAGEKYLRKLPGRIVGMSTDAEGKRGFLLTLQTREQHIRRERATSNICSNQALMVLANTVYCSLLGFEGLKEVGLQCMNKARYLYNRLISETPARSLFDRPFFNEFPLYLPRPAGEVRDAMAEEGYWAGIPAGEIGIDLREELILIAVTEKRTREEIDGYVDALKRVLR